MCVYIYISFFFFFQVGVAAVPLLPSGEGVSWLWQHSLSLTRWRRTRRASRALSGCCRISVRACPTREEGLFSFISLPISMKPAGFRMRDNQSPAVMENVQTRHRCPLPSGWFTVPCTGTFFSQSCCPLPAQSCRLNFQKVSRYFFLSPAIKSVVSSCSSKQKTTGLQLNLSRHVPGLLYSHRNQHMPTVVVEQNCECDKFSLSWSETCPGSCTIQGQTPQMSAQRALHFPSTPALRMQLLLALGLCPGLSAKGQCWKSGTVCDDLHRATEGALLRQPEQLKASACWQCQTPCPHSFFSAQEMVTFGAF